MKHLFMNVFDRLSSSLKRKNIAAVQQLTQIINLFTKIFLQKWPTFGQSTEMISGPFEKKNSFVPLKLAKKVLWTLKSDDHTPLRTMFK